MAGITLAIGFAGPWSLWFWMACWKEQPIPLGWPADHREAKAALCRNLRNEGRMVALCAMESLPKTGAE